MGVRHMQGVSAHIEVLHDTEHRRRHKARCKNYIKMGKICDCIESAYFNRECGGSSHCQYYKERGNSTSEIV